MEDVSSLTKEEFLRFLNCSHHSAKPERIVVTGPKNTKINVLKLFGKYTACHVALEEFSLNHQVLRVPLPKVDLQSLSPRQVALRFRTQKTEKKRKKNNEIVSRFGRKLKKKQFSIHSLIGTRSSSKYSTRSVDKNKNKTTSSQKPLQKFNKPSIAKHLVAKHPIAKHPLGKPPVARPSIAHQIKNTNIKARPEQKAFSKKMASWTPSFKQFQRPDQLKPLKPQFIIKYVPTEPTYFLKMTPLRHPEDGKLKYPFDTLVKDIKNMKLPSPTWKIKVVVKSNKIASIIFTNKCVLERTVSFNAKSEFFEIVIENKPAILLGSPNAVSCVEDIETLLNIIHTISAKNPMVYYKN